VALLLGAAVSRLALTDQPPLWLLVVAAVVGFVAGVALGACQLLSRHAARATAFELLAKLLERLALLGVGASARRAAGSSRAASFWSSSLSHSG